MAKVTLDGHEIDTLVLTPASGSPVTKTLEAINTYESGDEGKVVKNGALATQGATTLQANGTYDTTDKSRVTVAVSGGAGVSADLPKLFITGDINEMTAGVEVKKYSYVFVDSDGKQSFGYCSMKWQGESSQSYPKKNYTLKFFYDAPHSRKEKVDLLPLGLTKSKFVIKANWIDRSQARNIVSCRLWGQMVKSRHAAPPELLASAPNWGAINGYPIKLYVNGDFHGLYTFNIPKDEDLFSMDAENPLHCVVCGDNNANTNDNAAAFRSTVIGTNWELEVPDTWQTYEEEVEGQTVTHAVKDKLSDTIAFVINATDEEFIEGLNDHIDVESAIDYFLLMFIDRGVDSAARNLILLTYDGGNKWYCSAYDKDMTWGVANTGNAAYIADTPCPGGYNNTNSLLWERLVECFGDEIWERWQELKTTTLSPDYIKAEFDYFWKNITDADYEADVEEWPTMPQATIDFKYMLDSLIDARWTYMDGCIDDMRIAVPCTGIALDRATLSFSDGTPVTLTATLTPANTTDRVVWTSSDTSVATVSNGVVTPVGSGTATITATCGEQTATCSVTVSALSYTVTLSGSGATLSPTANVSAGDPYSGTLTADAGYAIDSVVVTMGGTDITASAYSSGSITIAAVTGNIVVTVSTSVDVDPTGLVYTLQSPLNFDGQTYVDTGFKYNADTSLSVFYEAENPQNMTTDQYMFGQGASTLTRFCYKANGRSLITSLTNNSLQNGVNGTPGTRFKAVFRFDSTRNIQSHRSSTNGAETTNRYGIFTGALVPSRDAWPNTLYLGGKNIDGTLTEPALTGKLHQFRIYTRRLTDAETAALLGVSSLSDIVADKDETA